MCKTNLRSNYLTLSYRRAVSDPSLTEGPSVLPPRSHGRVESVVEPLHCHFHHLSQGVILWVFIILVANSLLSRKQKRNSLNK